ncbi:V-type ATP synthase subunit F [Peptoniphilus sp. oral taxon 386]|uniref:V-type ATP synthase subunit F n=1 Tax=Peptoniphilus sp. oral taxon 386 TaxID=652713 RepID=UPI0001DAA042|nr:V-type ATP synthase subunit F [Peptoniphilus sp. oral taxon 386]EFI41613.1 ATP synthase, subunit F [Peptoniphilus sp. oral taxon 386 str. F0131]
MKSLIISRSMDILTWLRLAGVEGFFCRNSDELKRNFKNCKDDETLGIIILTESDFKEIEEDVIKVKLSKKLPLVVTIPDKGGLKDKDFILKYVKESVGVKIS